MELRPGLELDDEALVRLCVQHGIARLAIFGSVLRSDFGPSSDVDVLIEFVDDRAPGLVELATLELELEALVGREVEVRTAEDLSPLFRDDVRTTARALYVAA